MIPLRDTIPSRYPPLATWAIIAVNVAVFLFETSLAQPELERLFYLFGIVPARYSHPGWAVIAGLPVDNYWPFLTSVFLHSGWLHLVGNMWTLWIFGDNVEDKMGPARFLCFYLLCGIIAGVIHFLMNPHSTVPTVGASGAISGVLGAYFFLFPFAQVVVMVPVLFYPFFFALPAALFLLLWFFVQFFSGAMALAGPDQVGGVAWWAHIGGFAAGALTYRFFLHPHRKRPSFLDQLDYPAAWTLGRW